MLRKKKGLQLELIRATCMEELYTSAVWDAL